MRTIIEIIPKAGGRYLFRKKIFLLRRCALDFFALGPTGLIIRWKPKNVLHRDQWQLVMEIHKVIFIFTCFHLLGMMGPTRKRQMLHGENAYFFSGAASAEGLSETWFPFGVLGTYAPPLPGRSPEVGCFRNLHKVNIYNQLYAGLSKNTHKKQEDDE